MLPCINQSTESIPAIATQWMVTQQYLPEQPHNPIKCEDSNCCRICLEQCGELQYCKCFGSLLCHESCLRHYLNEQLKKNGSGMQTSCEICKFPYSLQLEPTCVLSLQACCERILRFKMRCACYALFFAIVVGYQLYMTVEWENTQHFRVLLLVIGTIIGSAMLVGLAYWLYEFLLSGVPTRIRRVLPFTNQSTPPGNPVRIHPT